MADQRLKALVVDDDDLVVQSFRMTLPENWRQISAQSLREVPKESFSAAFVDMHLSGNLARADGLDVVRELRSRDPLLEIVAISGDLDRTLMEEGLRAGASRFLAKPLSPDEVRWTLGKIEALCLLREAQQRRIGSEQPIWLGKSAASQRVQKQIATLRNEDGPILIQGESGTGKEVVAHLLHTQEGQRPLVTVNLGAVPENVFESEFFGHVRGAFTGAEQNKMGLAEAAHGGDLFLDEIEALPLTQQAKLLRFLESGEVRRVGAKDSTTVEVRVIAASNQDLAQMVRDGKFREDLLWRLNGKKIQLPALRERMEDLSELTQHFLQLKSRSKKSLSEDALAALQMHTWPGNVRELKRVCEQLAMQAPLPIIRAEDVEPLIGRGRRFADDFHVDLSRGLPDLLLDFEAAVLRKALSLQKEVDELCALLKISRSTFYKKLKDYHLETKGTDGT